jgi:hypothetical protein
MSKNKHPTDQSAIFRTDGLTKRQSTSLRNHYEAGVKKIAPSAQTKVVRGPTKELPSLVQKLTAKLLGKE